MVVKAAVIQIDGAHHRLLIVCHKDLGMDEAGAVLIDLHAGGKQRAVMGLGQGPGHLFIRDARQHQAHIHAPLGRELQSGLHLAVQDQVGGHDIDIALRTVENVHIHPLPHLVVVQRAIPIGQHVAPCLRRRLGGIGQEAVDLQLLLVHAPHLQEHQRKAGHRLAPEADGGILPMAKAGAAVNVFIGQIYPAGEGGMAVNDRDLPVIPVVIVGGYKGCHGGKHLAPDAQGLESFGIVMWQGGKLAGAVIHHPHIHAGLGLLRQDFQDTAPHQALINYEILQKNEVLRLLQGFQQVGPLVLPQGIILHLCVVIHRVAAGAVQVMGQGGCAWIFLPEPVQHIPILGDAVLCGLHQVVQPFFQHAHSQVAASIAIEERAHGGHQQDHQQPGDLCTGVCVRIQQVQAQKSREYRGENHKVGQVGIEPIESGKNQKQLEQKQEHNDA